MLTCRKNIWCRRFVHVCRNQTYSRHLHKVLFKFRSGKNYSLFQPSLFPHPQGKKQRGRRELQGCCLPCPVTHLSGFPQLPQGNFQVLKPSIGNKQLGKGGALAWNTLPPNFQGGAETSSHKLLLPIDLPKNTKETKTCSFCFGKTFLFWETLVQGTINNTIKYVICIARRFR